MTPRRGLCGFDRVVTLPPQRLRVPGQHTVAVEARLLDGRLAAYAAGAGRASRPFRPLPSDVVAARCDHASAGRPGPQRLAGPLARPGRLPAPDGRDRRAPRPRAAGPRPCSRRPTARCGTASRRPAPRSGSSSPSRCDDPAAYLGRRLPARRPSSTDADLAVAPTVTSFPLVHAAALAGVPAVQRIGEEAPLPTVVGLADSAGSTPRSRSTPGARSAVPRRSGPTPTPSRRATARRATTARWSVIHTGRPTVGDLPSRAEARRAARAAR